MTKDELLKKVKPEINLMIKGVEFDIRHLFEITVWNSYPIKSQEEIASLFFELSKNELKDQIKVFKSNLNLSIQRYQKIADIDKDEPTEVFPNEPIKVNRGSRGNA